MRLEGKTALVTGAGGGIGCACAQALAAQGADLVIHYGKSEEAARAAQELCRGQGVRTMMVQADLKDPEAVKSMFSRIKKTFGKLDILVCNAGITKDGLLMRMRSEDFDSVVQTNLYGTFYCMREASAMMLRQHDGRIISISSVVGLHGNRGQVNYAASKAGIIGMTKSLARETASRGITVNAIAPGMISTNMTADLPESVKEQMEKNIPLGYMGDPQDVANAVVFLASPQSRYITGQTLCVDGGMFI